MNEVIINPEDYPQAFGAFLSEEFSRFKEDITEYDDEEVGADVWFIDGKPVQFSDHYETQEVIRRISFPDNQVEYWFEDGSHLKYDPIDGRGYVFFWAEEEE